MNVFDCLSDAAKLVIINAHGCNVGIFSTYKNENSLDENLKEFSDFKHSKESNDFHKAVIKEYSDADEFLKESVVFYFGSKDYPNNPRMMRFLQNSADAHHVSSFLYKAHDSNSFLEIRNLKVPYVKYSYRNRVVKYSKQMGFFNRNPEEL